jgi:phage tail-like protein
MDVNGTRYQLLLGMNDWGNCSESDDGTTPLSATWKNAGPCSGPGVAWDDTHTELTLQSCLLQTVAPLSHTPTRLSDRRGADRDHYGNWYWIDRSGGELLVNSVGSGNTSHFWSLADGIDRGSLLDGSYFQPAPGEEVKLPDPLAMSGLVVTEDHYLVVGVLQPGALLLFDLYTGGPPQMILWAIEVPFTPFDMAPMPGGGLWILDRENARYWALDRLFHVISREQQDLLLSEERLELFQPARGGTERRRAARTFAGGILLDAAMPLPILNAVAIEALPDGTVLILDSDPNASFSLIYRFFFSQQVGQPVSTESMKALIDPGKSEEFQLRGSDFAFVTEHIEQGETLPDRLYVVAEGGNQAFPFNINQQIVGTHKSHSMTTDTQLELTPLPDYFPMRLYGGKALVEAGNQAWYDFCDGWVPLVELRRARYTTSARFYTPLGGLGNGPHAFDGQLPGCVWHRLMFDACIPAETSVQVYSRTADVEQDLTSAQWQEEPPLYLRGDGSELPFVEPVTGENNGTWELLFQAASGRFLQLMLVMTGNGRSTPHLRAMRIYYPRFSYLDHYLPAVYRDDVRSSSFLDRFLANLEGFYTSIEDKIATVQALIDGRSAPSEALDWLAGWFGIALDVTWDTYRQRLFLRHTMDVFQYRGTMRGLLMMLRLTLDQCPDESIFTDPLEISASSNSIRIVEAFQARQAGPSPSWSPAQGGAALRQGYTIFLVQRGLDSSQQFTLVPPTDVAILPAWKQYIQSALGFVPSIGIEANQAWYDFLTRRYEKIDVLNSAYQGNFTDFSSVPLSQALPPDGPTLLDWYQFQSIVLAMQMSAHQFSVLLPVPPSSSLEDDLTSRMDLASRVVEMGKPAHTTFDVKFYLAAFQIGVTRLGIDTFVDQGSRTPTLMEPLILGQSYVLGGYLASQQTLDATHREVLKREQQS